MTPVRPEVSSPGDVFGTRDLNRLEVRLARRTEAPAGIAR